MAYLAVAMYEKACHFGMPYLLEVYSEAIETYSGFVHANFTSFETDDLANLAINDCNVCIILALSVLMDKPIIGRICCRYITARIEPTCLNDLRNQLPYYALVAAYFEENVFGLQEMISL